MLVVFVAALIVLVIATNALSRAVRMSPLNKPDRILGAGFGVVCAWVAMGVAFLLFSYLGPKPMPAVVEGGATFPLIKEMANYVEPHLPPGFRTRLTQRPDFDPGNIQLPKIELPKPPQ
jgi:membrane protein required for colicin V production